MKRTKIMLTAIAIFAIAGGALAFKATKFGQRHYCYTTTSDPNAFCDFSTQNRTFTTTVPTQRWKYTTTTTPTLCTELPRELCTSLGRDNGI